MIRKGIVLGGVGTLALSGLALAASGPKIKVSVSPNKAKAKSALTVSATGPFGQKGLPTGLTITTQKGFATSAKSVTALCNPSTVPPTGPSGCPTASQVGTGTTIATVPPFGKITAPTTLYLGKPQHKGDIASLILHGNLGGLAQENVIGRLFKGKSGGIEILFTKLFTVPSKATLDSFNLKAQATNGSNSLINNPSTCSGHWKSTFSLKFKSGTVNKKPSISCTK